MKKYVKNPIPVAATQFNAMGDHPEVVQDPTSPTGFSMKTLENTTHGQHVTPSDWIITGPSGECYPCKDATFKATYHEASEEEGENYENAMAKS